MSSVDFEGINECSNIRYDPIYGVKICEDTGEVIDDLMIGEGSDNIPRASDGSREHLLANNLNRHDRGIYASLQRPAERRVGAGPRIPRDLIGRARPRAVAKSDTWIINTHKQADEIARRLGIGGAALQTVGAIINCFAEHHRDRAPSESMRRSLIAMAFLKAVELHSIARSREEVINVVAEYFGEEARKGEIYSGVWHVKSKLAKYKCFKQFTMQIAKMRKEGGDIDRVMSFVVRAVRELGIPNDVANDIIVGARRFLIVAKNEGRKTLHGKSPESIAAALTYLFARLYGYEVNQSRVAKAMRLKDNNVRKAYKNIIGDMVIIVKV